MNLKLDIKSIVILVLLLFGGIFFGLWYFKGSDTKDRVNQLEKDIKRIEVVRDSLEDANTKLREDFNERELIISERDKKIKDIESSISKIKQDLVVANNKLKQSQKELAETKKKIEELKNNPIKREGDDLINSLKQKLN